MEADRGDTALLDQADGELEAGAVAGPQAGAQLDRDRQPAALGGAAGEGEGQLGVAEQLDAGAGPAHLAHRAAHVDVDQVGAGLGGDGGAGAHHLGVVAEELHRDRVLVGMDPHQLAQGALVAVVEAEAGDHLRDGEARPVAFRLQAHEPVADPGQRREQDAVGDPHAADLEGLGQGLLGAALSAFRSWMRRRPFRVSISSTSSIVSVKGTIAAARPPVASMRGVAQLFLDAAHDPVDQAGEAEDDARLDRGAAGAADRRLRLGQFDAGDAGRAFDQGGQRDLEPGRDRAAEVLALGGDGVEVDPGAEVDDDAGAADPVVGGDRVDEPVGADFERVVDPDRHPGLDPGPDRQAARRRQVALGQLLVLGAERRHHRGDADRVDVAEGDRR